VIERIDELDEQICTQKIGILPGPSKNDELNDDELDNSTVRVMALHFFCSLSMTSCISTA